MTGTDLALALGLVAFGYLAGSLSPSVFLGRWRKGLDVRNYGSGNAGTTNAFRVLGTRLGIVVLIADIAKGAVPVMLARELTSPVITVVVALACVIGHNYSIFLRGKGGKGVATGAGVTIAMMPGPAAVVIGVFLVVLLISRMVSVASMTAAILLPVFALVFHQPVAYIVVSCALALLVLYGHRTNMVRLAHHTERRVNFPWRSHRQDRSAEDGGDSGRGGRR